MKRNFVLTFTILTLLLFSGCSNLLLNKTATIRFATENNTRQAQAASTTQEQLTDIVLTGIFNKKDTTILGSWEKFSDLSNVSIEINPGKWDFKLEAKIGEKKYEGWNKEVTIVPGENILSFVLDLMNPVFEVTINNIAETYNTYSQNPNNKGKTITLHLTDNVDSIEKWNQIKTSLKTLKNNVYVNLKLNFAENFNYSKTTKSTINAADDGAPIIPNALFEVTILDDTIRVGDFIFNNCPNLKKLTLPANTTYGDRTFDKCENLSYIDYKGTLAQWCSFDHYTPRVHPQAADYSLVINNETISTNLTIPEGVVTLGAGAFKQCSKLTTVTLPNSLESGGVQIFDHCYNLSSINIPAKFKKLPEKFLYYCSNLKNITIPETVTQIGYQAFSRTGLTEVNIPASVESILGCAFEYCKSLNKITFNKGLKKINAYTFRSCESLTSLEFPDTITEIGKNLIEDSGITSVKFSDDHKNWKYKITEGNKEKESGSVQETEFNDPVKFATDMNDPNKYLNASFTKQNP